MTKEDVLQVLGAALSLETDEVAHRLMARCYQLLTGQPGDEEAVTPERMLAYALSAATPQVFRQRLAAYYALDGQLEEAMGALESARYTIAPPPALIQPPARAQLRLVAAC